MVGGLYQFFIEPFQFDFLRNALLGCLLLSASSGPLGVFLLLRRMTLIGDALSHGLLPGIALGFILHGISIKTMVIGGILSGVLMGLFSTVTSRTGSLKEDASFAGYYLISTALGLTILYPHKTIDLTSLLFGSVLGMTPEILNFLYISSLSIVVIFILMKRPLTYECCDPVFFKTVGGWGGSIQFLFLTLVTLNLVSCFQALGTLMSLGLMILPAITARIFVKSLWPICLTAVGIGSLGSYLGLLTSYHWDWPTGPMIVLILGGIYIMTLLLCHLKNLKEERGKLAAVLATLATAGSYTKAHGCSHRDHEEKTTVEVSNQESKQNFLSFTPVQKDHLEVVVTFSILKDFVEEVGGKYVKVVSLVGFNGDPHVYEPKPSDNAKLSKADMVVVNGLNFEGWMDRLLVASKAKHILTASQGLKCDLYETEEFCAQQPLLRTHDPHGFQSLPIAQGYVENIAQGLSALLPQHKDYFQERKDRYIRKLKNLHQAIQAAFAKVPKEKRIIVTSHKGFEYYGRHYDIKFLALLGISSQGMTSGHTLRKLVTIIKQCGLKWVFFENMSNPSLMKTLAKETGLTLKGPLYSDSLSEPSGPASTYYDLIVYNTNFFLESLNCSPLELS